VLHISPFLLSIFTTPLLIVSHTYPSGHMKVAEPCEFYRAVGVDMVLLELLVFESNRVRRATSFPKATRIILINQPWVPAERRRIGHSIFLHYPERGSSLPMYGLRCAVTDVTESPSRHAARGAAAQFVPVTTTR